MILGIITKKKKEFEASFWQDVFLYVKLFFWWNVLVYAKICAVIKWRELNDFLWSGQNYWRIIVMVNKMPFYSFSHIINSLCYQLGGGWLDLKLLILKFIFFFKEQKLKLLFKYENWDFIQKSLCLEAGSRVFSKRELGTSKRSKCSLEQVSFSDSFENYQKKQQHFFSFEKQGWWWVVFSFLS